MTEAYGSGAESYRPRHAAVQLDDGLTEALAEAADQYRYRLLYEQYDAEFAIARARLFSDAEVGEDDEFIVSQRRRIADSIGRQAVAKAYADELRAQLYYVPSDGEQFYQGRHRAEDLQETGQAEEVSPLSEPRHEAGEESASPVAAELPEEQASDLPSSIQVPERGRLRHIISDEPEDQSLTPGQPSVLVVPAEEEVAEERLSSTAVTQEREGLFARLRSAWYAAGAVVSTYFTHPEKGRRRRIIARTVAALGGVAAALTIADLADHAPDHTVQPPIPSEPVVPEPTGPPPNTEHFFDELKPYHYNAEPYEWTAAANCVGPAEATPKLLRLIEYARQNGLVVDTWGDPACGHWGINSVTVQLPDGTEKSYYDTPRKLAILQWFAGGAGP